MKISTRPLVKSVLSLALLFAFSCQKEGVVNVDPIQQSTYSDSTLLNFIMKLGYKKGQIVDKGSYYMVDGDIMYYKEASPNKNARPSHRAYGNGPLASPYSVANATVRVNNNFGNQTWYNKVVTATQEAVSAWNSTSSGIHLTYTSGFSADIVVEYDQTLDAATYGAGTAPQGCTVGYRVGLNGNTISASMDASRLKFLLVHELGHNLGFEHTDGPTTLGFKIPDTPDTDVNSVMKSGTGITNDPLSVRSWNGFTSADLMATRFLYPISGPTIEAINDTQNFTGMPLRVTWTPAKFCTTDVQVAIYYNDLFVKNAYPSTANDGRHNFAISDLVSGREYEIRVFKADAPNDMLYTTFSF